MIYKKYTNEWALPHFIKILFTQVADQICHMLQSLLTPAIEEDNNKHY